VRPRSPCGAAPAGSRSPSPLVGAFSRRSTPPARSERLAELGDGRQKHNRQALILSRTPFTVLATSHEGDTAAFGGFDQAANFALEFLEDNDIQPNGERVLRPPQLKGMSGCPVWRFWCAGEPVQAVRAERARVVGVQTGTYDGEKILKATHWRAATYVIERYCPELRPALRLHLP